MVTMTINGNRHEYDGDPGMPIPWLVRDELVPPGTEYGCGRAPCGASTVHLNGQSVRACIRPVSAADGAEITTIEGLDPDGNHAVQKAWRRHNVPPYAPALANAIFAAAGKRKRRLPITNGHPAA